MTINYTTNLSLAEPVTGTESGTWGDDVNKGITDYLDIAIAGTLALTSSSFTANALTLANTQGSSSGNNIGATTAQYYVLKVSSLAANVTITAPSSSKSYVVVNLDSTYSVTVKASGQTGITVPAGQRALIVYNGTDYVQVGASAGGATTQVQYNNGGALAGDSTFTFNNSTKTVTVSSVLANGSIVNPTNTGVINYGTLTYQDTNIISALSASFNGYTYTAIQNQSSGGIASADFAIYNNNAYYVNAGINSSGYGSSSTTGGTGGVSSTTLTITAVASGNLLYGSVITGTGISGTVTITTQLTSTGSAAASPTFVSGGSTSSNQVVLSSIAGIAIGYLVSGTGVPAGTFVGSFTATGNGVNLVNAAGTNVNFTVQASGTYNFYVPGGVGTYTMSSAQTINNGTTITGQVAGAFNQPNNGYIYSYLSDMVLGTYSSNSIHLVTNNNSTDAVTINTSNAVAFNGSYGTAGYYLQSNGSGSAPTWTAVNAATSTYTRTSFTATASQTTFSVTYTVGYVAVYFNGVLLNGSDYTATNGTSIVLAVGANAGDIVEVIAYSINSIGTINASNITGTLAIANGGTNSTATPTAGGVGYGTGTAHAFTAAGTTGQVLTSAGTGTPTWSTLNSGAMVLISTQTASNSSNISFTGLSGYDKYFIVYSNIVSASLYPLVAYLGTGAGPTYISSGYYYNGFKQSGTGAVAAAGTSTSQNYANISLSSPYTGSVLNGYSYLIGVSSGNTASLLSNINGQVLSTSWEMECINVYLTGNTTTKTAIQFFCTTGNITSGTISLYGITS